LGRKLNMSQIYDDNGTIIPVTMVATRGNVVTDIRTKERDGYEAVQVGEGNRNPSRINKAQKGQFKDMGNFASVVEFRMEAPTLNIGDKVEVSQFQNGDMVTVSAISKGKGFQGVVKRHGFGGGPRSHGQKHSEREPGSIGGGLRTRVPVGTRMAGRMGNDRVTVKNLKVVNVDESDGVIYIAGAVPGRRGSLVEIVG
ncbi:MAG: 50S ribosomal protein L3, partial [Patescibacteria group bacterium]|nr:50S ribosomal protein L3 [Patescibacteria group bacterium]